MMPTQLKHAAITHDILTAFYDAYNALGYGFVESVYTAALEQELRARSHAVAREYAVHVIYKGTPIAFQRVDMLVDDTIVVEIKASAAVPPFAERQLLNYLRGTNLEVGLLLHSGPKPWFKRVVSFNRAGGGLGSIDGRGSNE